jgi:hypothetical protein
MAKGEGEDFNVKEVSNNTSSPDFHRDVETRPVGRVDSALHTPENAAVANELFSSLKSGNITATSKQYDNMKAEYKAKVFEA